MFSVTNTTIPVTDTAFPPTDTMFPLTNTVHPIADSTSPAACTLFPLLEADPYYLITLEDVKVFHKVDRELYSIITKDLLRDPIESMTVMALWIWLEKYHFTNVVKNISCLHPFLITEIADEARMCLNYLKNPNPLNLAPELVDLPAIQTVLGVEMTLNFFHQNQNQASLGIEKALNEVCFRALKDLMKLAKEKKTAWAFAAKENYKESLVHSKLSRMNISNSSMFNPNFGGFHEVINPEDRTMFVTFSKGFPVQEQDIIKFFNVNYGDCVESLHMEETEYGKQSLYARVVFHDPYVIGSILNGVEKLKFTIKGRHMWMRKFVPKYKLESMSS